MKVSVDGNDLFELTDIQKKVITNDVISDEFESDMHRRLQYILTHKYERCFERLKNEWIPKLIEREILIPKDEIAFAELVFNQKDYMDRKDREEKLKNK